MISPARTAAYDVLRAISTGSADLPTAIASARATLTDERDRALAADIAAGVMRWRAALDHLIAAFARRPIEKLDPEVVDILRLSAYQLLHLTRVPASAIVDDAVDLVRRAGKRSAAGFANAVLRSISRGRGSLPLPPRPVEPLDRDAALDYFSVTLSHPRWLAARWYERLGFDATEAWLQFNNAPAGVTLRANRLLLTRDDLANKLRFDPHDATTLRPTTYAPDGLVVESGHPLRGPGIDAGWFIVQDEASQLVTLLAGADPGRRVLDTCASPGGKTTAIAAAMHDEGLLVACDVRDRRVDLLRRTVAASGAHHVRIVQANLLRPLPFSQPFDLVFVDAPCSGLGTLRRDPDLRWRRKEEDLPLLAAAELTMLQHAADAVAPGGRLVYATCSSEPDENDGVVDAFLATTHGFTPVDARTAAPSLPAALVDARGRLATRPDRDGLDAFFGAVFERRKL
jgi:16S rRNA (cytosine967-C5)-methyltransferase